jgi:two-component system, cell cycle response regulator
LELISTKGLRDLTAVLTNHFPRLFSHVDVVTLTCVDPEYRIQRLIDRDTAPMLKPHAYASLPLEAFKAVGLLRRLPQLGPVTPAIQNHLFPEYPKPLGSVALAPLWLRDEFLGTFNQGSLEPLHFTPQSATDLLQHLSAIVSLCLENALSREQLKLDGLTDALTGVANRRFFERRLQEEWDRWQRDRKPLSCMLIDIDHFKEVNDHHGHRAGDAVLQATAGQLGAELRVTDVLARYGGEEFILLLPATGRQAARRIAERLRRRVAQTPVATPGAEHPLTVTISIGLATVRSPKKLAHTDPTQALVEPADQALYQAKADGRNRVVVA